MAKPVPAPIFPDSESVGLVRPWLQDARTGSWGCLKSEEGLIALT